MENLITQEMAEAGKWLAENKTLEAIQKDRDKYWHCMSLINGYNVNEDGSLSIRTKSYNEDRKAG